MEPTIDKKLCPEEFVKQRYTYLKSTHKNYSLRWVARKARLKSHSHFAMVISGQRRLTDEILQRLKIPLKLSDRELKWLTLGLQIENAPSMKERLRKLEKMKSLEGKQPVKALPRQLEVLNHITSLSLYLLSQSSKFEFKVSWMMKHLQVNISEIELQKHVDKLFKSGLWKRDETHSRGITPVAPKLKTGSLWNADLLKGHLRFLDNIKLALTEIKHSERFIEAQSFLCSRKDIPEIQKRVRAFKKEIEEEFEDLSESTPFQLNISFTPLIDLKHKDENHDG